MHKIKINKISKGIFTNKKQNKLYKSVSQQKQTNTNNYKILRNWFLYWNIITKNSQIITKLFKNNVDKHL